MSAADDMVDDVAEAKPVFPIALATATLPHRMRRFMQRSLDHAKALADTGRDGDFTKYPTLVKEHKSHRESLRLSMGSTSSPEKQAKNAPKQHARRLGFAAGGAAAGGAAAGGAGAMVDDGEGGGGCDDGGGGGGFVDEDGGAVAAAFAEVLAGAAEIEEDDRQDEEAAIALIGGDAQPRPEAPAGRFRPQRPSAKPAGFLRGT